MSDTPLERPDFMHHRHTGGGCGAWELDLDDFEIWITGYDGSAPPSVEDEGQYIVAIYAYEDDSELVDWDIFGDLLVCSVNPRLRPHRVMRGGDGCLSMDSYYFHTDDLEGALNWVRLMACAAGTHALKDEIHRGPHFTEIISTCEVCGEVVEQ